MKRQTSDPTQGKLKYAKAPKIADPKHTQGLNDAARLVYEDNFPITGVASSAVLLTVLTSLPILQVTAIPITKPSYHSGFDPIIDPIIAFVTNPNYQLIYRQPNYNGKWSLGLMPFGLKSLGLIQLVTWLNFFKLSVSGIGHLA